MKHNLDFQTTNEELPKGVYQAKKKDGSIYYRSSLTFHGKHISLGSFPTKEEAHQCYLEGYRLLNTNVELSSYQPSSPLSFEKWVMLINFRDNKMYIKTPIYVKSKYFYYYLSPTEIMKFSSDDLFYYAHHTIQRRGNHFFVSDYGMQVNIVNRYGIKNFAVKNRDYQFINGDPLDFRYENIQIINQYQGVEEFEVNGWKKYRVKIHVNGNLSVGTYKTEYEAAIAYNKAIDILKSKGIDRNYTFNYIENLSSKEYAEIYTKCKVSPGIRLYEP